MAYWFFSDEVEEYNLADEPFHGGMGPYCQQRVKEGGYQAMRLLAKLDDELLEKGDYYFITRGEKQFSVLFVLLYPLPGKLRGGGVPEQPGPVRLF